MFGSKRKLDDFSSEIEASVTKRFAKCSDGFGRKHVYPRSQGGKASNSRGVCTQETADGVAREPHDHSVHRRISTRE
jgi:hypothetical protein